MRFQHRRSSFKELQYICDGDKNGVIYYAGTSYGEHQWVNPVLAKVSMLFSRIRCMYYSNGFSDFLLYCFRKLL